MADVKIRVLAEDETKGILKKLDLTMVALTGTAVMLAKKLAQFTLESTKYAARVETLAVVTEQLGENAGYTLTEIRALERGIQKKGITTEASRQSLAKMMQAELDLADATNLARLAQDAAVIAGTNSSEAFSRLVDVISTGNVRMARTMGLQVDFNAGYEKMAEQLGKTTDELTSQEQAQSRANSVMSEGAQIAGSYTSAMESVGKQLASTPRYWDEFKRAFGEANIDKVGAANNAWQKFLKNRTEAMDFDRLYFDALEDGLITMDQARQMKIDIALADMERADAIEFLISVMDDRDQAIQDANVLQNAELITNRALIETKLKMTSVMDEATKAQMALREEAQLMGQAWFENSEQELRVMQIQAIHAGNYDLATSIGEQIDLLETQNEELEDLIAILDELDGKVISYDVIAKRQGSVPSGFGGKQTAVGRLGGVTAQADGGPLASTALVGERGPEMIINGIVIPADQTRRLMGLGLTPQRKYGFGGAIGAWEGDSILAGGSSEHGWLDPVTGASHSSSSFSDATNSLNSYLSGGGVVGSSGAAGVSAAAVAGQAAASAGAYVATPLVQQMSASNAANIAIQNEVLAAIKELAKPEDIQSAVQTAFDQSSL